MILTSKSDYYMLLIRFLLLKEHEILKKPMSYF